MNDRHTQGWGRHATNRRPGHQMSRRRAKRLPPPKPLTVAEGYDLAAQLLRELSDRVGNHAEVDQVMRRWLDEHDVSRFGFVALAAVRLTFAECMTRVDEVPPGALAYHEDYHR